MVVKGKQRSSTPNTEQALHAINRTLQSLIALLPKDAQEVMKDAIVNAAKKNVVEGKRFRKEVQYSPYAKVAVGVGGRPEVKPKVADRCAHVVNLLAAMPGKKALQIDLFPKMKKGTKPGHMWYSYYKLERLGIAQVGRSGCGGLNWVALTPTWRRNARAHGMV